MKIYTKTGDSGETQVYADKPIRLSKDDVILECYGTLDELNAQLGLLNSMLQDHEQADLVRQIQKNLFQIGFAISASSQLPAQELERLEQAIDALQASLPPQQHFILPGGCQSAAQAHVCRTVARRAERQLVRLAAKHQLADICLSYVNRLSDYCFVLARALNQQAGIEDTRV